jgi:hypothetical protein
MSHGLTGSFMIDMMDHPSMMRNVMVAGGIHHGKTSLLDMLVLETHQVAWDADRAVRLADLVDTRANGLDALYRYPHLISFSTNLYQVRTHVARSPGLSGKIVVDQHC